jgi:hypothetical protein
MARNFLRAVLFDLGGTLMYERAFPREFRKRLRKYFQQREKDLLETT